MRKAMSVLPVIAAVLALSLPTFAHHGTGISYDSAHPITLEGAVVEFRYANPHPQIFFEVTDSDGKVTRWAGEVAPTPFTLQRSGWNKRRSVEALKAGTKIKITLGPSRVGAAVGVVIKILNDKGEQILTSGAGPE